MAATDDACPWCGESMDGGDDSDADRADHPFINPDPLPGVSPPGQVDDLFDRIGDGEPRTPRRRRPVTPHWDSGIRCNDSPSRSATARAAARLLPNSTDRDTTRREALASLASLASTPETARSFHEQNTTVSTDRPGDR